MKIGIITGEYPPMRGGVGDFTRLLALGLRDLGHNIHILTDVRGTQPDDGLNIAPIITKWDRASLRIAARWATENALDVINLQFETAAYAMSPWVHFLPRVLRPLPVVTTFHDLKVPYLFPKAGPLRRWSVMALAKASAGCIATNAEDITDLNARGVHEVTEIPIGSNIPVHEVTDAERAAFRDSLNIPQNAFLVGYFGLFTKNKGVFELIEDMSLISLGAEFDAYLVFIGAGQEIQQYLGESSIAFRTRWTGYLEPIQVSRALKACDIIALPFRDGASFRRGSLLAALAHGCAIVTTPPTVPLPELDHAVRYIDYVAGGQDPLADEIYNLWENPQRRLELSRNAKALAARFTWPEIAERTAAYLTAQSGTSAQ